AETMRKFEFTDPSPSASIRSTTTPYALPRAFASPNPSGVKNATTADDGPTQGLRQGPAANACTLPHRLVGSWCWERRATTDAGRFREHRRPRTERAPCPRANLPASRPGGSHCHARARAFTRRVLERDEATGRCARAPLRSGR